MDVYNPVYPGLYYFDTFTFTTLGTSGRRGPESTKGYANAPWRDGDFSIVDGQQQWTVPATGTYRITAAGAYGATPGRVVSGDVDLNEGQTLSLLVGQQPTPLTANVVDATTVGGGGGTFIGSNGTLLMVASGGDGTGGSAASFSPYGTGNGKNGGGYLSNGLATNATFKFLTPAAYINGGFGNSFPTGVVPEEGGFGGGQSPVTSGISGGGGYTGSPGDGISGATCYGAGTITDLGASSNSAGYVTVSLIDPVPIKESFNTPSSWIYQPSTLPYKTTWSSVAYGNGIYVAVSNNGTYPVTYSTDGINWNTITNGYSQPWVSVTYANGLFVAVANNGCRMSSADAINWSLSGNLPSGNWVSVTYGNGVFVAMNLYGYSSPNVPIIYSYDGINWISSTNAPYGFGRSVTYGNGKFVAISNSIITSSDGINWIITNSNFSGVYVTYGGGKFVAITYNSATTSTDGITWTTAQALPSGSWRSIAYGNGIYVAVQYNSITTSTDGVTWTNPVTVTGTNAWESVAFGNNTFVATSGLDVITSPDGVTWTSRTATLSGSSSYSVNYVNNLFFIMFYGYAVSSPNGITWTVLSVPSSCWPTVTYGNGLFVANSVSPDGVNWYSKNCSSVTYGNGKFVAISKSLMFSFYSTDGLVWTNTTNFQLDTWSSVAYGDGKFVAVANNGVTANVMYSSDGIAWSNVTTGTKSNTWSSVTYGNGTFIAVAPQTSGLTSNVMYSTNGTSWTIGNPLVFSSNCITFGEGYFVAPSSNASITSAGLVSGGGGAWNYVTLPSAGYTGVTYGSGGFSAISTTTFAFGFLPTFWIDVTNLKSSKLYAINWSGAVYGNGLWVTAGNGVIQSSADSGATWSSYESSPISCITYSQLTGVFVAISNTFTNGTYTSNDGINWVQNKTLPSNITSKSTSITYGKGLYVAVLNGDSNVFYSRDGVNWLTSNVSPGGVQSWNSVSYGNEMFIATASNGNKMSSSNGTTWITNIIPSLTYNLKSVAYGNGTFVAVSANAVVTSPDGITWTLAATPSGNWSSVTYANGKFVAVRFSYDTTATMTSTDGTTWTQSASGNSGNWKSVTYGNGKFVAVGDPNIAMTSSDGITWESAALVQTGDWRSVTYANGKFVAVGGYSVAMTSSDGSTWASSITVQEGYWDSVTYGNGKFVATGYFANPASMSSSDNGVTWISSSGVFNLYASAYGNGKFAGYGYYSLDGISWTQSNVVNIGNIYSVIYANGIFVGVGYGMNGTLNCLTTISYDGINWTAPIYGPITYLNNMWFSAGFSPAAPDSRNICYSKDGVAWYPAATDSPTGLWTSFAYGNGYFVAVNSTGSYPGAYSQNGINWTPITTGFQTSNWCSVSFGNDTFMALNSSDGNTMISSLSKTF